MQNIDKILTKNFLNRNNKIAIKIIFGTFFKKILPLLRMHFLLSQKLPEYRQKLENIDKISISMKIVNIDIKYRHTNILYLSIFYKISMEYRNIEDKGSTY